MQSNDIQKQIDAAEGKRSALETARQQMEGRVNFLTLQAEALEYPAQNGDTQAQEQRGGLLAELAELAAKLKANEQDTQQAGEMLQRLTAEYNAARLAEETVNRNRAAVKLIECYQEIADHRAAIEVLNEQIPAMKAEADQLNQLVHSMGGARADYSYPLGSEGSKAQYWKEKRGQLLAV
jgi:chromosome segregation ATPase